MAVSGNRIRLTRSQIAIAAMLVVSACTPAPHRDGTVAGDFATMLRAGDGAREAGDPSAALPLYQRAHRLDPQNPVPIVRVAETFNRLGAYREAGDAWVEILRLEPRNFDALVGYGNTLTALQQPLLALEYFNRAQKIGETPVLFNGMGVSHDMLGNATEAQKFYRKGLMAAPDSPRISGNLGLSLALSGELTDSINILERVEKMPGSGVRGRQNLALAYALAGFSERARTVSSQDLDGLSVQRNMAFYRLLADMDDHATKVAAVGAQTYHGIADIGLTAQNAAAPR